MTSGLYKTIKHLSYLGIDNTYMDFGIILIGGVGGG